MVEDKKKETHRSAKEDVDFDEEAKDEHDEGELEGRARSVVDGAEDNVEQDAEEGEGQEAKRRPGVLAKGAVGAPKPQHHIVRRKGVLGADLRRHADEHQEPGRPLED